MKRGTPPRRATLALATAFVLVACGDDPGVSDGGEDAGGGDGSADAGADHPDIPWIAEGVPPLSFVPCPEGFREVTADGVTTCDPYPEGGAAECPFGQAHFPGASGCAPIGSPCPTGAFSETLPADVPVTYVDATAAAGGDGTLSAPYATLTEVPWLSLAGATVALAKGTYPGTLGLSPGTRVVGACAAETRVTGADSPVLGVVTLQRTGEPAVVADLSIADAPQPGVWVREGRALSLEGVLISRTRTFGIFAVNDGSEVLAARVVVDSPQPNDDGTRGRGINIQTGARLEASDLLVANSLDGAIFASENSEVVLDRAVLRGTREELSDLNGGRGLGVQLGSRLEASNLLIDDNRDIGLLLIDSEAMLDQVVVRGTRERISDGTRGRGLSVQGTSSLTATRLLVDDNRDIGIRAATGARLILTDTVIRGTLQRDNGGAGGRGIGAEVDVRLMATRLLVDDTGGVGIVSDESELMLIDTAIRNTRERPLDGTAGLGLIAQYGGSVVGTRLSIVGARENGIIVTSRSTIELTHALVGEVARSAAEPERVFGHGAVCASSTLRMTDFRIRDVATCGVLFERDTLNPAVVVLTDGVVERTSIGACVQVPGYDLELLSDGVDYVDNESNLESTTLPLPEPVDSVDGA